MKSIFSRRVMALVLMTILLFSIPKNTALAAGKSVQLNRTTVTMNVYEGVQLRARVNAKTVSAKWSSSNTKVATVSKTGLINAKAPGQAVITANINGVKKKCKVTVKSPYANAIKLLSGKWYSYNSALKNQYYRVSNGYYSTFDRRTNKLIYRRKIRKFARFKTGYMITFGEYSRFVFYVKNGKVSDLWYYYGSNYPDWNASGSESVHREDRWK